MSADRTPEPPTEASGTWTRLEAARRSPRIRRTVGAALGTSVGSAVGAALPFVVTAVILSPARTDVFFLVAGAGQLAAFLLATVVEGAALPSALRVAQRDVAGLRRETRRLAVDAFILAVPVTVGLLLVGLLLLSIADLDPEQLHDGRRLLLAFLPLPALVAVSSTCSAAHYAQDHFAFTAASQGLRASGGMAGAFLAASGHGGTVGVALGLCIGEACRALLLSSMLPRSPAGPPPLDDDPGQRGIFLRSATPLLLATMIVAVNPLVDKAVASQLDVGSVTLLELAEKLFYIPMVLLFTAVTVVSGVVWARFGEGELTAVSKDFWRVQRLAGAVSLSITAVAAIVVLSLDDVVVEVLGLAPGAPFGSVFGLYILGLPFALAQSLAGRLLVVLGKTRQLPAIALALVLLNLVADVVGAATLGVRGIALASSLVRIVNAAVFLLLARRLFQAARST